MLKWGDNYDILLLHYHWSTIHVQSGICGSSATLPLNKLLYNNTLRAYKLYAPDLLQMNPNSVTPKGLDKNMGDLVIVLR